MKYLGSLINDLDIVVQQQLGDYILDSDLTATKIVNTLGTTPVNRATADANGDSIDSTYIKHVIASKKYTDVYNTNTTNCRWMFMRIIPKTTNGMWHIIYRLKSYGQNTNTSYIGNYICEFWGYGKTLSGYKCWNARNNYPFYYHTVYYAKTADTSLTYGNFLGIYFNNANNDTSASYKRTFEFEIFQYDGCDFEFLPTAVRQDSTVNLQVSGTNTNVIIQDIADATNYNAADNGLRETGDDNTYSFDSYYNERFKVSSTMRLNRYILFGFDKNGLCQGFSSRGTAGTTTIATKASGTMTYNTVGIDWKQGIYYHQSSGDAAVNSILGTWRTIVDRTEGAIDFRYTDNCIANNSTATTLGLVELKKVYIRGTLGEDGLFYLAPMDITYNNNIYQRIWTQDVPTSEDGYCYWEVGYPSYNSTYSAYSGYQVNLLKINKLYKYIDGEFRPIDATLEDLKDRPKFENVIDSENLPSFNITVDVDSALSTTSSKPVKNSVITNALNLKQDKLTSGSSIKTINNISLLGAGNIDISFIESDPIFSASPAATITDEDILKWNAIEKPLIFDETATAAEIVQKTNNGLKPWFFVTNYDEGVKLLLTGKVAIILDSKYYVSASGIADNIMFGSSDLVSLVSVFWNNTNSRWDTNLFNCAQQDNIDYESLIGVPSFKTINGESIIGTGDITIIGGSGSGESSSGGFTPSSAQLSAMNSGITSSIVSDIVTKSGNQTISGTKTFSKSPIVPTPTADTHAATKKYVDDALSGKQATISDLATIRSGAALGATAIQKIKTINGESLIGEGNITISGGSGGTGGDVNIIETVKVNGSALTVTNKAVDIIVPTESTVSGWGFTKNTGTYSKPSGGIPATDLTTDAQNALAKAANAIPFNDTYIANFDTYFQNGYAKASKTATINHPALCTGDDKWGVVFFLAENATNGTGTQMYYPIDGTYKGRIFYRAVKNGISGTKSLGNWELVPLQSEVGSTSTVTESTVAGWGFVKDNGLAISGITSTNFITSPAIIWSSDEYTALQIPGEGSFKNSLVCAAGNVWSIVDSDLQDTTSASTEALGNYLLSHSSPIATQSYVSSQLPTQTTISNWGFTKNVGTVTSVNNVAPVNGNVTLSIPSAVTESTVSGWGFTKNSGTVTSVNNVSPVNGNVTISIPDAVTESTVSGWGFTKNAGTVTGIKLNSSSTTLSPSSGTVTLGLTAAATTAIASSYSASSTDLATCAIVASAISGKANSATTISGYGITDAWKLSVGTLLTNGQDLNSITTVGNYYSNSASLSASLVNSPYTTTGFRLVVFANTSSAYLYQEIYSGSGSYPRIWRRLYKNGTWTDWYEDLTESNTSITVGTGSEVTKITIGSNTFTVHYGTSAPSASTGSDGDIYLQV